MQAERRQDVNIEVRSVLAASHSSTSSDIENIYHFFLVPTPSRTEYSQYDSACEM